MFTFLGGSLGSASRALRLPVLLGALLLLGQGSPAMAKGPIFRFVGNGDAADVQWFDGTLFGFVSVLRGGDAKDPQTLLSYSILQIDPCCATLEAGFGTIPNGDLTGSATGHLFLDTDTSAAANPDFNRTDGNGGAITVQWRKETGFSNRFIGTAQQDLGSLIMIFNGVFESHFALAEGDVIGTPVAGDASASLIQEHGVNVTVEQGH